MTASPAIRLAHLRITGQSVPILPGAALPDTDRKSAARKPEAPMAEPLRERCRKLSWLAMAHRIASVTTGQS